MKKLTVVLATLLVSLLAVLPSYAAQFKAENDSLILSEEQSYSNLYLASQVVTVNSAIKGDLFVAGGSVMINGPVENSLYILGGTVTVRSTVGHSLKLLSGNAIINGTIKSDVIVASGSLTLDKNALIEGDLIAAAGELILNGKVNGNIWLTAGTANLNGQSHSVTAYLQDKLTLGPNAQVNGDLNYRSPREAQIDPLAKVAGKTQYKKTRPSRMLPLLDLNFWLGIIGAIFALWLITYFMPKFSRRVIDTALEQNLLNLLYGLMTVALVPIVIFFLLISGVGVYLAIIIGALYLMILLAAMLFGKLVVGYYLVKSFNRNQEPSINLPLIATGVLALGLVSIIPFIGFLLGLMLLLLLTGTVVRIVVAYRNSY